MSALRPRCSDYSYTVVNISLPYGINEKKEAGNRVGESDDLGLI